MTRAVRRTMSNRDERISLIILSPIQLHDERNVEWRISTLGKRMVA